jgi:hypothetical protein
MEQLDRQALSFSQLSRYVRERGINLLQPGALFWLAQMVHDIEGTSYPMTANEAGALSYEDERLGPQMNVSRRAVSIAEVLLPDGSITFYASSNNATLSLLQRAMLGLAGIPTENILYGAEYRFNRSQLPPGQEPLGNENHAEQVILRNLPAGAQVVRWGISWRQDMVGLACETCAGAGGVNQNLVETEEQVLNLLFGPR